MVFELGDFMGCGLRCRAGALAGTVVDFLLDETDWNLRYVQVRLDPDPQAAPRLLPIAAFPPVRSFDGRLSACLTPDEFARGLVLTGPCERLARGAERELHDALHWMPYWSDTGEDAPCTLHAASGLIGAPLDCCGESFGQVDDLLVDTENWAVPALCVRMSGGKVERRLHLPASFIRAVDRDGPRLDSDVRAAALACAPAIGDAVPDSDDLDRLRQHLAGD